MTVRLGGWLFGVAVLMLCVPPLAQVYSARQVTPRAAAARDGDAQALVQRVIDAKGGLAALKRVQTVEADAETELQMPQGAVRSTTRTYVAYPDRYRVDAMVAGVQIVQVYNAGRAWVKDPAGVHDAPPAMRDDFAASVRRDMFPLLLGAADGQLSVRRLPDARIDGQLLRALEISGPGVDPVTLYIDDQDRIARQAFTTPGPTGTPVKTEEVFSDYRTVDGVRIPFVARLLRDGTPALNRTLTRVVLNGRIDAGLFERPQ